MAAHLPIGERQQVQHRRPARQRLAHAAGQEQILRACEQKLPGFGPPLVNLLLDIGEQVRRVLDLIENSGRRKGSHEAARIDRCRLAHIWRLKRDILGRATEDPLQQRGLTGLPRPA